MGEESSSSSFTGRAATAAVGMSGDKGCLPSLSIKTRIVGFASCFAIGFLLSMLSTIYLFPFFNAVNFAVLYTFGNVLSLMR